MNSGVSHQGWLCAVVVSAVVASVGVPPVLGIAWPRAQADNPPAAVGAPAGRATQGASPAREVFARTDKAYYLLSQDSVTSFDAVYDLRENGENAGTVRTLYNLGAGGATLDTTFSKNLPRVEMLKGALTTAWRESLLRALPTDRAAVTQVGDLFKVSCRSPVEGVASQIFTIAGDYHIKYMLETGEDQSHAAVNYKVQTIDGKYFLESMDIESRSPNHRPLFVVYEYAYARREGIPFISKLQISHLTESAEGPATKYTWDLELKNVTFHKATAIGGAQPQFVTDQPAAQGDDPQTTAGAPTAGAADEASLAKEVIARMDEAYYQLWDDGVTGFDAIYDVNENAVSLGTLQVKFSLDADGGHFASKLQEESPSAATLYAMLESGWLESLFKTFSAEKARATRIEDSFNLFYQEPEEDVRLRTLTISNGYRLEHEYEAGKDLSSDKLEFTVQTIDGKYFVASVEREVTSIMPPNRGQLFVTYRYTYARQEGVPFIRTLHIDYSARSEGTTTEYQWDLTLKSVTFGKTAAPADTGRAAGETPERPKKLDKMATQWDELSQEVIAGICRSNIDFGAMPTFARSLRCDIDIRITSNLFQPATGTLNYWWQDEDDNGLLIGDEIQIEIAYVSNPAMRVMMQAIQRSLVMQTATAGANVFRDHFIKTVRVADGYKMKLVPAEKDKPVNREAKNDKDNLIANRGYDALYLTVSPDFRVQRMRAVSEGADTEMVMNVEHEKIAGLWAAGRYYREVVRSGRSVSTEDMRCEYTLIDGFPAMRKLTLVVSMLTGQNTMSMKQEYTIRDCKIAWRAQPLDFTKFVGGEDDEALFKDKPKKPAEDEDAALFR
ncbi:MAG: hypothetical protein ABFE13_19890 [Phycisphaerales bacterium]